MNINLNILDVKKGYFPIGKGYVTISVDKADKIKPFKSV
jgi:hypothetical protein